MTLNVKHLAEAWQSELVHLCLVINVIINA